MRLIPLFALLGLSHGLFEDQAFKFDWRLQHNGGVKQAVFWETSKDAALITVSDSGPVSVLAARDADNGNLRWRHVSQEGEHVVALYAQSEKVISTVALQDDDGSGTQAALRNWSPMSGGLISEKIIRPSVDPVTASFILDGKAYLVSSDGNGRVEVAVYSMKKGEETMKTTFSTGSKDYVECANTQSVLACFSQSSRTLFYAGLPLESPKGAFNLVTLDQLGLSGHSGPISMSALPGYSETFRFGVKNPVGGEQILLVTFGESRLKGSYLMTNDKANSIRVTTGCKNIEDTISVEQMCIDGSCQEFEQAAKIQKIKASSKQPSTSVDYSFSRSRGRIIDAWATCDNADDSFQLILLNEDLSLTSLSPSAKEIWIQEEDLSNIRQVEVVSKVQEYGEVGGNTDSEDILGQFLKRIKRHLSLLQSAFNRFLELKELAAQSTSFLAQVGIFNSDVSIDDFDIHKVIVSLTNTGNLFAIDSKNGDIIWKRYFPAIEVDKDTVAKLVVQRSSDLAGLDPRCALIYTNQVTKVSRIVHFNPLTGKISSERDLGQGLSQVILLHHPDQNHLKPVLLIYANNEVRLEPESAVDSVSPKTFVVTLKSGLVQGQKLFIGPKNKLKLTSLWTLSSPDAEILQIQGKPNDEVVHSQGRVLADRSVMFKYINPNLGLILCEGVDAAGKNFINVYLADLVTGKIAFSTNHKRVRGPYHVVHSENWAIYTYYNEKARRGEVTSFELFEGATQSNSTVFSSLSSDVIPLVDRQAYILGPSHVTAIKDTRTEKGITSKNLLMATSNGMVFNVPRHILDPRRPNMNTPVDVREPGLPPYIPELVLPPETVLNYNQSLARPRGVVTAPTGLESTSVAFVYGLDLYCTRVTPSKGFDLLKEDFDYYVISLVLVALVAASYATKKLSQRKNLKQAWR